MALDSFAAGFCSAERAPLSAPTMPKLPSWQAYSKMPSVSLANGSDTVHGRVHTVGSSTVYSYLTVSASIFV